MSFLGYISLYGKKQKYLEIKYKRKKKLYVCWMITEAGRGRGKYVFEVGRSECPSMPQVSSATALTLLDLHAVRLFHFQSKAETDMKY